MIKETTVLHSNGTWQLVLLLRDKSSVGCCRVYTMKAGLDGKFDCLKAFFVAKSYTQIFGLDYSETFSLVAKITFILLFISLVAMYQ